MAEPDYSYETFTKSRNAPPAAAPPPSEPRGAEAPSAPDAEAAPDYSYRAYQKSKGIEPEPEPTPADQRLLGPDVAEALARAAGPVGDEGEAPPQAPAVPPGPKSGWATMLGNAVTRGVGEMMNTPEILGALAAEASGDMDTAKRRMREVEEYSKSLPQPEWNFQDVHNAGDFGYWLSERFGENAANLALMFATGGAGGAISTLGRAGLTRASEMALREAGAHMGAFAAAAPLSVAGVAREQYGATGSTQPAISIGAGTAGAWLQTYLPAKLWGGSLGPGFWNSVWHGALTGGIFGTAQEGINILARKMTDPTYEFASQGPNRIGWGERLGEAGIVNTALGAALGPLGMTRGPKPPDTTPFRPGEQFPPGQEPGARTELPPDEGGPPPPPAAPAQGELPLQGGRTPNDQLMYDQWYRHGYRGGSDITDPDLRQFLSLSKPEDREILAEHGYETDKDIANLRRDYEAYDQGKADRAAGKPLLTPEGPAPGERVNMMRLGGPRVEMARPRPEGAPREAPPEAPEGTTGATAPEPGIITRIRRALIREPISPDRNIIESTMGPGGDAFGAGPLLRATVDAMYNQEAMLNFTEANTVRYVVE